MTPPDPIHYLCSLSGKAFPKKHVHSSLGTNMHELSSASKLCTVCITQHLLSRSFLPCQSGQAEKICTTWVPSPTVLISGASPARTAAERFRAKLPRMRLKLPLRLGDCHFSILFVFHFFPHFFSRIYLFVDYFFVSFFDFLARQAGRRK